MKVIINQFAGLGDVLFIEPIYRYYFNKGFEVIAPVNTDILWIQEYIPYVQFVDKEKYHYSYEKPLQGIINDTLHIPLRFAHPLLRGYDLHYGDDRKNWMPDKYTFLGLEPVLWRTLQFNRNYEREKQLIELLQLPEEYIFVNNHFGGSFEKVNISVRGDAVFMRKIEGFSMIDWGLVIEGAKEIHTVETSLIYLVESLQYKAEQLHLYPRFPFLETTEYMKPTLGENWIYHDKTDLF